MGDQSSQDVTPEEDAAHHYSEVEGDLFKAIQLEDVEKVQEALEAGASANAQNEESSALILATVSGCDVVVSLLIDHGASVSTPDRYMRTPLHLACKMQNYSTVQLLLNRGARVDVKDFQGNTPLCYESTMVELHTVKLQLAGLLAVENAVCPLVDEETRARLLEELSKTRDVEVIEGFSLYDVLARWNRPHYLTNSQLTKSLDTLLNSPELRKEFPNYSFILKNVYQETRDRLALEEEVSELSVWQSNHVRLDDLGIKQILRSLTNDDLKNLMKSPYCYKHLKDTPIQG